MILSVNAGQIALSLSPNAARDRLRPHRDLFRESGAKSER